ncbi:MAG: SMP-30/gluconolactonase/LRE family protein [Sedimentisphaerales bacterium]|nr:SMP-30/gluconolactonase/LRE family protein [Sedimentisphaerales bacterium]
MERRQTFQISFAVLFIISLIHPQTAMSQESAPHSTIGEVVIFEEGMNEFVASDAKIELLASGLEWSEGPLWIQDAIGGYLLFSDIPRNSIMKWKEREGISLFMKPSGYTGIADYGREPGSNGLMLDRQGRMIFCEHGDRRISRLEKDGGKKTLADSYMGKRFNSPNDAVVKSNGDIYFTDPPYGLPKKFDDPTRELDFCGVYRLSPDGEITLLTKEMTRPNGIAFSPDETLLYVAQSDSKNPVIKAFLVNSDGILGRGKILFDFTNFRGKFPGSPDGLKVDQHGNLFATGPGGVYVITPEGNALGRIHTGKPTSNCAWGDDGSVLYMTVDDTLCRIKTKTKGAIQPADPVREGLILDLDADHGITLTNGRIASWENQVDFKAKTFIATRDSSHQRGTGHPVLKEKVEAIGGHNTVVFKRQELINFDEDAFDHLILGSGYTWFAVMSVYSQVSGLKDVNSFFGNLKNGGKYEGFWAGLKDDNTLWIGSRNGITFGRWDQNNPQLLGPQLQENCYYVIAGRMGAGIGKVTIELFINDNKPVASIPFPVNPKANASKMAIGQERDATNHPGHESFDGELARLLMWDRPLSNHELEKLFSQLKTEYEVK